MATIALFGLDIGKHSFHLVGQDANGKPVFKRQFTRSSLIHYLAQHPACRIVMEACCGAHWLARQLAGFGHQVQLIAPQYVRPFVTGNKNDFLDAHAICEAASRPSMRYVGVKTPEQQASSAQYEHYRYLAELIAGLDSQIGAQAKADALTSRLMTIPGIGPITASQLAADAGNAQSYGSARHFAASLGLVPRQHSTGGKSKLLGISKRGDKSLRRLLVQCARVVMQNAAKWQSAVAQWTQQLMTRRHSNVVACALANKLARIVWAVLVKGEEYRPNPNAA
ncbi:MULTISPECIES: IS110 family transposase [Aeromonas]|uniref:IS110 family transposase n=1 Tax=Aeromonas TaxID=642 RepID=UPI0023DDEBB3|nr:MULTISPECIES: IS110 family transposase [Aeromonas]MDF2404159.1 IS110 family transposase [Aeromonas sp. 5HA1]MDM5103978.1 IS110 family transposase [Aeromonas salmonicida]HDN9022335.1 IS110 family transposase [Aeromonas salmonicida]